MLTNFDLDSNVCIYIISENLDFLFCKGLVTNYGEGGYKTGGGGHVKFYPFEKGGWKKF